MMIEWPKWIRSWPCVDSNCDGKGTACAGVHDHGDGDYEYELYQCQFCDEREQLAQFVESQSTEYSDLVLAVQNLLCYPNGKVERAAVENLVSGTPGTG